MRTLAIKIAFLSALVIGCQSTQIIYKADKEITKEQEFSLNTEATFRPFAELLSIPQPAVYDEKIKEWYYGYFPNWSMLKKVSGGTALTRTHGSFTVEWYKIYNNARRAYVTNDTRLAMYVIDTL